MTTVKLAGQASVCKFTIQCPHELCGRDVNYTDAILCDALIRGTAASGIQLDFLSDKNQDMSLEDVLQFVEAKEAGKRSASRLLDTLATDVTSDIVDSTASSYKKKHRLALQTDKKETCTYCG
ncbi:hypothetical protein ElyMa_002442600 [Elysia marginata]|uniref:Uncharacterized protein n=1 Tax=Elysia marginata TaxID=1093978 RepID=A0AAV4GJ33_9GAST|nr:hypothetical protein ElyMa_002442600 [Elysia marginata]